jgi:L-fuconolactonase
MIIDSHQHFWNLEQGEYPWLTPELDPIYRTFEPPELALQLEAAGVDGTATFPEALQVVAMLAESVPDLTMIIDHLANPPIKERLLEPWASQLAAVAVYPNVYAKVSGLGTLANRARWSVVDLQPYVKHAMACFGADRLMFGSDWPVCLQAGDYAGIVRETRGVLASYTRQEQTAVLGGTAARIFAL